MKKMRKSASILIQKFLLAFFFSLFVFLSIYFYFSISAKPQKTLGVNVQGEESNYQLQDNQDGTQTYISNTGYTLRVPVEYKPMKSREMGREHMRDEMCEVVFTKGGMGEMIAQVAPYSNEPLKEFHIQHFPNDKSYRLRYEDVFIHGRKSLIIEAGEVGDSGSGTRLFMPVGQNIFILSVSYMGKDGAEFRAILNSINVENELSIVDCGKNEF